VTGELKALVGARVMGEHRHPALVERTNTKGLSQSPSRIFLNILDAFTDERVGLSVGSWFDRAKLKHAVVVINELLAAHGHQFATLKPSYETNPSSNTVTLVFNIDEGPKAWLPRNSRLI
jgi:outer membrane protein insertion porin family